MDTTLMMLIVMLAVALAVLGGYWLFLRPRGPGSRIPTMRGSRSAKDHVWAAAANRHRDYR